MNTLKRIFLVVTTLSVTSLAQNVYEIPFASKNNIIEMEIANISEIQNFVGEIEIIHKPEWIKFTRNTNAIELIAAGESATTQLKFDINKDAPVDVEKELVIKVLDHSSQYWEKVFRLKVLAPDKFEVFQNYPNPFNPVTIISFQLPSKSEVILNIYNLLGQKLDMLINEIREPGLHKVEWNASNYASGLYFFTVQFLNKKGVRELLHRKMMYLK
jgi:hypothetical protein